MELKLEETAYFDFTTHNSTGEVVDASVVACDVFEDANDTPIISPTPIKRTGKTGNYRVQVDGTTTNGFEINKTYNVIASATTDKAGKGVIATFKVRAIHMGEVATQEAVLTRLASKVYAGGPTPSSVVVTNGTVLSGTVADIQSINQKYLKVQETGKYTIDCEITGMTHTEAYINFVYRYFGVGTPNHKVEAKIWSYITSAYVDVLATDRDLPHSDVDNYVRLAIPGTISDYFSGVTPNITAKIRIEHVSNPDSAHQFWLDYLGLGELERIYEPPDNTGILSMHEAIDDASHGLVAITNAITLLPSPPSVQAIDTQLSNTHGAGVWGQQQGGSGANQITIQCYLTATTTPVADVSIQILNTTQTLVIASGLTNDLGQVVFALDDGTYKVRQHKSGYNFTVPETLTVLGSGTQPYYGSEIAIGAPLSANTCRVYEWCFGPNDTTPLAIVTAEAKIEALPYNYNTKLHAGSVITKVYDPVIGKLYWDIVYGASVRFIVRELGVDKIKTVPALSSKRLYDMT